MSEMLKTVLGRHWLVDELRVIAPPQHFGTRRQVLPQREAIRQCLDAGREMAVQIYVHVPFCEERCTFCMYFENLDHQGSGRVQEYADYLGGLIRHTVELLDGRPVEALYVGGGTASILSAGQIRSVFAELSPLLSQEAQATYEMSPRSTTTSKQEAIRSRGFNRLSFGLQTLSPALSSSMHRKPTRTEDLAALLRHAAGLGFEDVNVDLMVGVKNEGPDDLYQSACRLLEMRPPSISIYRESRPRLWREELQQGVSHFLEKVVRPRITAVVELARDHDYESSGDLASEHVRLFDSRWHWPSRPPQCSYRTRHDPRAETCLVGIGPSAFSFAGGKVFSQNKNLHTQSQTGEDLSTVHYCSPLERAAALTVNQLYLNRSLDRELFAGVVGSPIEEFFQAELDFLQDLEVIEISQESVDRTCEDGSQWAYLDKVFYPQAWIDHVRVHGF